MSGPLVKSARHAFGIAAVAGLLTWYMGGAAPLSTWATAAGFSLAAGALVAGLAALFFTKTQGAQWPRNFANVAWVVLGLLAIGGWTDGRGAAPPNFFDRFDQK